MVGGGQLISIVTTFVGGPSVVGSGLDHHTSCKLGSCIDEYGM